MGSDQTEGGMEDLDIVIVGGGICGLATALALHRKGITSVVLERSETLRSTGAGIAILTNGWRALDHLAIAPKLRQSSVYIKRALDVDLDRDRQRYNQVSVDEARCVIRSDLINALAEDLPQGTIRFSCDILSVRLDRLTSFPILELSNGRSIRAKVLIGCDGANSAVARYLELKPLKTFSLGAVRGFTYYSDGHGFPPEFVRIRKGGVFSGRVPINDKLAFWFVLHNSYPQDPNVAKNPELIRQFALDSIKGFPLERIETVANCDLTSLSLTHLRYRAPWEILVQSFHRGTVAVAGDAMHVMGPFLGQGGSAAIEDAVVLARCLTQKIVGACVFGQEGGGIQISRREIEESLKEFVRERRMRLVWLSTQTYLIGSLQQIKPVIVKFLIILILVVLFRNPVYHTLYDCGRP